MMRDMMKYFECTQMRNPELEALQLLGGAAEGELEVPLKVVGVDRGIGIRVRRVASFLFLWLKLELTLSKLRN